MQDTTQHWEKVFESKAESEFSWFQPYPKTSIEFLELFNLPLTANIIDVGGGDSHFIDALLQKGYQNIYLLDISANAIERVKKRLGSTASKIHFIHSDITDFKSDIKFDFWHDRAAFHFLTSALQIEKYVTIARQAINPKGYLVLGTFSENGPKKCSGLEIKQYNKTSMNAYFEKYFERLRCIKETHKTPFETNQEFLFCSFQRNLNSID